MADYSYLVPFVRTEGASSIEGNNFWPVKAKDIAGLEEYLGCSLPNDLKDFYIQIGSGFLDTPKNPPFNYECSSTNRINHPLLIIEMMSTGSYVIPDYYEDSLQGTGDIPVFEIGDSSSFMHMKPRSDNPNAIWYCGSDKIEDSFERFIYNLYHDGPDYYSRNW